MSLQNPVTPPGIEPGTARLVAQRLNHYHYDTPGPVCKIYRTVTLYTYNYLPEDEPSGSKHVEDIRKLKINLGNVHFDRLYFIMTGNFWS
jgi:hypothetical protein